MSVGAPLQGAMVWGTQQPRVTPSATMGQAIGLQLLALLVCLKSGGHNSRGQRPRT